MQIRLLGQIEAVRDRPAAIGGPMQRRVLAALALRSGDVVSVSRLVDISWPDGDPPDRAEHNVRTYVHRLRAALDGDGALIETAGGGYRLAIEPHDVDVVEFERLASTAGRMLATGETVRALDLIAEAEQLWRGGPLLEFEHEDWAVPDVVRLRELHIELRVRKAEALLDAGRTIDAVGELDGVVRDAPLREEPRALLMRALYESGRQAEALRAFQEFRKVLIEETGTEPSALLLELDRSIATGDGPSTAGAIRTVGAYELHERIGEGAFATVHRATQTALDREVAVKIVRAELANQPEFIRRFEAEARMVARIEHPNVVPLYDYWREPDRAFLVMRWMTGGSLEQRLDGGPWTLTDTVELVDQIAAALDAAHARGVVHRDVKPANIMFDDAGRAHLGDFGIALDAEERSRPEAALSEGSPIFASPEQLRREPAGPEADVHALAIVAFNALTCRTPFDDAPDEPTALQRQLHDAIPPARSIRPDLPGRVDDVLAVATAKDPAHRYPTASGFASALRAAAADQPAPTRLASRVRSNPYKGLAAFDEADAADFYGRERLVDELVDRLSQADTTVLAVVGPSGSGKSSVVRAGLLPALRAGRVPGSASWFVTSMLPGSHPYEALETALLRVATNPPSSLLEQLCAGERGILRGLRRILPDDSSVVTVVIDQFEELFSERVTDDERNRFLSALAVAAREPGSPARFVITLRADFYDRPLRHQEFAALLKQHTVVVTPLAPDELEHAIVGPADAVGVAFEPGLVAEIIADVHHEPGALPLMQYALTGAFEAIERSNGDTITVDAYRSIGGLTGALARRADELFESDPAQQEATRRLFGRLVSLESGADDTRRRVRLSELPDDEATNTAIGRFAAARLLTVDRDPATRESTIEIAHEALIRTWPRLRNWLDDDRETIRVHRHLTAAATEWDRGGGDASELYRGTRLDMAEPLRTSTVVDLNSTEAEFLETSIRRRDDERATERRRVRRLRRLLVTTAVVAVLALIAGALALRSQRRANDVAFDAETSRLAATARDLSASDPRVAALVALSAYERDETPETLGALQTVLVEAGPLVSWMGVGKNYQDVELLDGDLAAGLRTDGVDLFDRETGRQLDSIALDASTPFSRTWIGRHRADSDRSLLVVASEDDVRVYDTSQRTLAETATFTVPHPTTSVSLSGETVAATSAGGAVRVWTLDGDLLVAHDDGVPNLAEQYPFGETRPLIFPDLFRAYDTQILITDHTEDRLVYMYGSEMVVVDIPSDSIVSRSHLYAEVDDNGVDKGVIALAYDVLPAGDGSFVLVGPNFLGVAGPVEGLAELTRINLLPDTFGAALPDIVAPLMLRGQPVVITSDGRVAWYEPSTGERTRELDLGLGSASSAAPDEDGGTTVVATGRGLATIGLDGAGALRASLPREPAQTSVTISDSGRFVAAGASGGLARGVVFEEREGRWEPLDLDLGVGVANTLEAGEEALLNTWTGLEINRVFRLEGVARPTLQLEAPAELRGLEGARPPGAMALTVVNPDPPSLRTFSLETGEILREFDTPDIDLAPDVTLLYSNSGDRLLLSLENGTSITYDASSGHQLADDPAVDYDIAVASWNDDDTLIATASSSGDITIRDGTTFEPIRHLLGTWGTSNTWNNGTPLFAPDDSLLLTNFDGPARLWDVATGTQIGVPFPMAANTNSGISVGDEFHVVTASDDSILVWNVDPTSWPSIACRLAGSNLTEAEWQQWGPRDEPRHPVCPN